MRNLTIVLDSMDVPDRGPHTAYYLRHVSKFYHSKGFRVAVVSEDDTSPACATCGVPVPVGHVVLYNLDQPAHIWRCWECFEQAYLDENPDVVPPPELDQFRDTGRR